MKEASSDHAIHLNFGEHQPYLWTGWVIKFCTPIGRIKFQSREHPHKSDFTKRRITTYIVTLAKTTAQRGSRTSNVGTLWDTNKAEPLHRRGSLYLQLKIMIIIYDTVSLPQWLAAAITL